MTEPPMTVAASADAPCAFVLDDENKVGSLVCRMLDLLGYSARAFSTVAPCLTEIRTDPPDIVVLDLALGQSDAVEVMRHLELLKYRGKVLLISGRDEATLREIRQIGERHGLAMLPPLRKPFRVANLREALQAEPVVPPAAAAAAPAAGLPIDPAEALQKNWLELWYQPKFALEFSLVSGAEALLRARHPQRGLIGPADLLPPPDDPLHWDLSLFVLERAMADWAAFAEQQLYFKLSVNVPLSVLAVPDFSIVVRRHLPDHPFFPGLVLEITEHEMDRDLEAIREAAAQLKLYHVTLSIDDFGSGYSSLSRLHALPFAELKLDRSLVTNCSSDPSKKTLCESAIDLAHRFGASACAEGVENPRDIQALAAMGCDTAQGFLLAKPMSAEQLIATFRGKRLHRVEPRSPLLAGTSRLSST